jgi:hypothetical protein
MTIPVSQNYGTSLLEKLLISSKSHQTKEGKVVSTTTMTNSHLMNYLRRMSCYSNINTTAHMQEAYKRNLIQSL